MKDRSGLFAVLIISAFLISGIPFVISADDSSADSTSSVLLSETLLFDSTNGSASAKKINDLAGTNVCEYSGNCLEFKKSVNIIVNKESGPAYVDCALSFNDSKDQEIEIEKGITVNIDSCASTSTTVRTGLISKTNSGNLDIEGDGTLNVTMPGNNANLFGILCKTDICVEDVTLTVKTPYSTGVFCRNLYANEDCSITIESGQNGVLMTGGEIYFDNCKANIKGNSGYGMKSEASSVNMSFKSCNIIVAGGEAAFNKNPSFFLQSLVSIYGSHNINGTNRTSGVDDNSISNYRYISVESQFSSDFGDFGKYIAIIVAAIVIVVILIIVISKTSKKIKSSNASHPFSKDTVIVASGPSPNQTSDPLNSKRTNSVKDGRVEVMTQSLVKNTSFILMVDGATAGYIGPQRSFIDVQSGMREISIAMNDSGRKVIFRKNFIVRPGTSITVTKKFGGYKVEIQ